MENKLQNPFNVKKDIFLKPPSPTLNFKAINGKMKRQNTFLLESLNKQQQPREILEISKRKKGGSFSSRSFSKKSKQLVGSFRAPKKVKKKYLGLPPNYSGKPNQ